MVEVPLVLHGASGLSDDQVRECVKRGMCKVNFATELRDAYSKAVKETFAENENTIDPVSYTHLHLPEKPAWKRQWESLPW